MRILGIDPGLQVCGYGCLEAKVCREQLVEAGFVQTDRTLPLEQRLLHIANDIDVLLDALHPEIVAVEELYAHYAHPRTAILMGHARGVILQRCAQQSIEVRSYSATKIKKSTTGHGRASKEQMQRAVQAILQLPDLPEPNDVADAIAIAMCCANALKVDVLSKSGA